MKNWKDYNTQLIKNSIELINENQKSNFNSEEKRCYNHIRDLVALEISNIDEKKNKSFRLWIEHNAMVKYSK